MISFVIPARNESKFIANTLKTIITHMSNTDSYEIIVVDNASMDNTAGVARQFDSVKIISLDNQVSISKARNLGVAASVGEIIAFLDADILITESWVCALLGFVGLARINKLLISGHRVAISKKPSLIELIWFDNIKTPENPSYINSGNLVTTRALFNTISGFDEYLTTGEDVDFCIRAKNKGATIQVNKNFFAHHEGYPKTIKQFMKREQWHGIGDTQSWRKFLNSKVAMFSWAMMLMLCASLILSINGQLPLAFVTLFFFVVINSLIVRRRFNVDSVANYSLIFVLHLAYMSARCSSIFTKKVQRVR